MNTIAGTARLPSSRRFSDRVGDRVLFGLTALASLVAVVVIVLVIYQIVHGAVPAISKYGLGFLVHDTWNGSTIFGGGATIYGTLITSAGALLIAAPLGIAIGLFLSQLTSPRTASVIGPLVELLAAVPSVIIGLWGIVVLAPIMRSTIEPALHNVLGFIPLFGSPSLSGSGIFTAIVILAIMALPIIAAITRDLFLTVPSELKDGALALGATRWEMVRGVVLGSMRPGIASACILGAARALGEAIAVLQVIGFISQAHPNLFDNGTTLAAMLAGDATSNNTTLETASIFYLGVILLGIELIVNLAAQAIVRHYRLPSATGGPAQKTVDVSAAATAIDVEM
ncbi:MAG TPA: phosphate ABC transporter permease subunit PstC [Solirubrobacteraceae bacterium]|nr:phosphate ABC transporter permease subunit PstC [Solirubrobacteraceae bacterium]